MSQPFFTIAIPTYNRRGMLAEALASVVAQSFADFEIIVGNDYVGEVLTSEALGIADPRLRVVNHPHNLQEVGNMNLLLALASGRYFTWLFDDDLYEPDFLQTVHDALVTAAFPPVLFPSFRMLKPTEQYRPRRVKPGATIEFSGGEFLDWYAERRPQVTSTNGLFQTALLKTVVGGVEALCPAAIGFHCEYLLLVKSALLERIVYLDAPGYVFRRHGDSASESNQDLENYRIAGRELLKRCSEVVRQSTLQPTGAASLLKIARIHVITFAYVISRFEFAQQTSGAAMVCRALSRHWRETMRTRAWYLHLGGAAGLRTSVAFLNVEIYCCYVIVRLLAHFAARRGRQG